MQINEIKTKINHFVLIDFSLVLPNERRVMEQGEFEIMVRGSSKSEELLKIEFKQEQTLEIK